MALGCYAWGQAPASDDQSAASSRLRMIAGSLVAVKACRAWRTTCDKRYDVRAARPPSGSRHAVEGTEMTAGLRACERTEYSWGNKPYRVPETLRARDEEIGPRVEAFVL
ncbi:hypothetical protein JX265_006912 [Neoarthrinium moseri]|uniref:Uncharacterized protein n=1 Tax=Neoarthrinium moseri TaxID=1658444 RepID=A0A9P9WL86_9PEZI|nr:hypothetical protein JX265_006912 [Neoarthrinium moseri]